MSDFIKELEEDIKEEQLVNLWKKYGKYIIGAAVGIVVMAGAVPAYKSYQASQDLQAAATYKKALRFVETNQQEKAIELFDELINGHKGYGTLASLQKAALLTDIAMDKGQITLVDEARAIYQKIAAQNPKDPSLRGLATVLEAYRAIALGEGGNWVSQLEPLTAPGQPWSHLAQEALALYDMKQGRAVEAAQRLVKSLQDRSGSTASKQRSMLVLAALETPVSAMSQPVEQ